MKKEIIFDSIPSVNLTDEELFEQLRQMLNSNLEDPVIGKQALILLELTRRRGFDFQNPAEDCPECAACIFMALMSATSNGESSGIVDSDF
jgi:hypothetical protein